MKAALPAYFSAGEGPPVVLLHCTLSSKNQWRALSGMLEQSFRVIAVDLYGYGDTPMPENAAGFTLLDEARLVHALVEAVLLPDEPFHLVGHSYGGAVALRYCHHFPQRVKTLTVFEPVAFHLLERDDPGLWPVLAMMQELSGLMGAGENAQAAATFLDYWSGPGSFANFPPRVQKDFAHRTKKLELDFKALTRTPLSLEDYRQLRLPVTVIAGRLSRTPALRVAEKLSGALPCCTLRWVDTGHMGPVTHPELVNPIIKESLAD
jgi:pimeloyl-ACP methyl ester carboxylesterase